MRQIEPFATWGVSLEESAQGGEVFYTCVVDANRALSERVPDGARRKADQVGEVVRERVSWAVAETIVRDFQPQLLLEAAREIMPEGDETAVADVIILAQEHIGRLPEEDALADVASSVSAYLREEKRLHLGGFVKFRLGDYRSRLRKIVGDAVGSVRSDRSQREFVKLLAYLIDHQESAIDELHVYPAAHDSFEMRDAHGSSVDADFLEAYVWDLAHEGGIDKEDLLISALVSLAPRRVLWHFDRAGRRPIVLEQVLGSRLKYCQGCEHCASVLR